ncbi:MAG: bifunctional 2-keto-4-hydroxyglutarate aldolase/2-keto-3-deoxy-6-phosphogluconate aldolase, partial [Clostridium sp.]|nr:bifunctional 2-keto-4-hydroxyglutarate aldolase/2-keto-3-deoxy-6-phosphogluconate aldolase [Clostridium sp.]
MKREEVLGRVKEAGVVAVVRGNSKEQGLKIVEAAVKGGIKVMELTMTVPNPVDFLKEVVEQYKDTDIIVGAGTVLDSETA